MKCTTERVWHFKILLLTYKALNNLAPQYLSELLTPYTPTRVIRSSEAGLLSVQTTRLKTMGDRAFTACTFVCIFYFLFFYFIFVYVCKAL